MYLGNVYLVYICGKIKHFTMSSGCVVLHLHLYITCTSFYRDGSDKHIEDYEQVYKMFFKIKINLYNFVLIFILQLSNNLEQHMCKALTKCATVAQFKLCLKNTYFTTLT